MSIKRTLGWSVAIISIAFIALLYVYFPHTDMDSGGVIRAGLQSYDVLHYDLSVRVDPSDRSLNGANTFKLRVTRDMAEFECDLDRTLDVKRVVMDGQSLPFEHAEHRVVSRLPRRLRVDEIVEIRVEYGGNPRVSRHSPWIGGFVWSHSEDGDAWVGVACQDSGGDLWWPCKDDPADEPDQGMSIAITAPSDLRAISNGRLLGLSEPHNGWSTTYWGVSYPINTYLVTVNIGPYTPISATYTGIDGSLDVPILFWALPEHLEQARQTWADAPRILRVLGKRFGEYPYLRDKYWAVETPYLGMEHQTVIAYGSDFKTNDFGFDWLLLHETAHEWWGNKVSVSDWADYWLQEGFATYSESIFVNDTLGIERYHAYMGKLREGISNNKPLVQGRHLRASKAYHSDIYGKGACVLHTLRYLMGDAQFFKAVRQFATSPATTHGNNVNTSDFTELVETIHGQKIPWFWKQYLYQSQLPKLKSAEVEDVAGNAGVRLTWDPIEFQMPVPVVIDGQVQNVNMTKGTAFVRLGAAGTVQVDPLNWILKQE